jgi:hypothetical protein
MPLTFVNRVIGTIVSPWPPSTSALMFVTETPIASPRNVRKRAVSNTPAMPIIRFFGRPVTFHAAQHIASSGFVTRIRIAFGEYFIAFSAAVLTISKFAISKSSRLMPGFRGKPAVITTMSDPAVGS